MSEDEMNEDELLPGCAECGGDNGAEPHDPQCMSGRLESIEVASNRLRRLIALGSPRPHFGETAQLLCRRMRAAATELETELLGEAMFGDGGAS